MSPPSDHDNPYASPQSSFAEKSDGPRFRPLAVFVGWIVDIVFTSVITFIVGIVAGAVAIAEGVAPDDPQALTEAMNNMPWVFALAVLAGGCGTLLGGYVAARMGKGLFVQHALAMGVVSLVTGLVPVVAFLEMQPLWVSVVAALLTIPAALLGGAIRQSQLAR